MLTPEIVNQELGLYARRLCSGRYLTKFKDADLMRYTGPPRTYRNRLEINFDKDRPEVTVRFEAQVATARFVGDQGSVILPADGALRFKPVAVNAGLPDPDQQEWPMGDAPVKGAHPEGIDLDLVRHGLDAAFEHPDNETAAVVVVHRGLIVGERYAPGIYQDTQLESWSMGKSLLATVFARLLMDRTFSLEQPAPIREWNGVNDPRAAIRICDILRMSSNLDFSAPFDSDYDSTRGYPDHSLGYSAAIDAYDFARCRPLRTPDPLRPKSKGQYRNCDPWLLGSLIKEEAVRRGENPLLFPQRLLFDKIGIRRQVIETDPFGNLIFSGCDFGTARNWARLGLLYLEDGVWNGERLLPEDWVEFVSKPAPAWDEPIYGAHFWLPSPKDLVALPQGSYYAKGHGGQATWIIPKHQLVVVRMGFTGELSGLLLPEAAPSDPRFGPGPSMARLMEKILVAVSK